jgi:hypothetical protein
MAIRITQNESVAANRRMYFHCVDATDGITAETGEAGGQPQLSLNGAAWTNSTNVLVAIGNGRYYLELTQAEANLPGVYEGRYKSAATAEIPGTTIQVTPWDPTFLMAWAAGEWQDKSGVAGTYEILSPYDGVTVIAEVTPGETTPYRQVTIN